MVRIGKIVATHGLQGALVLSHVAGTGEWLKKDDVLFLELRKDSYIPFFVTQAKPANHEEYIVYLEDVTAVEDAKKLINKGAYVKEDILNKTRGDSPLLWIGFNLVDRTKGSLGIIDDVLQAGVQWLAKLMIEDKEVLIPLVKEMIVEVNMRNKYIRMDLPEGLVELYLEN